VRGNADGLTKRQLLPATTVMRSRALRKDAGEPERRMWRALREALPDAKFRRQVPLGAYHADFCSHAMRLVIEIDGDDHALRTGTDAARTTFIEGEGYRVVRFTNHDVMEALDGVLATIATQLDKQKGRP
jgi:very-short-patch-repair endonuclease